MGINNTQSYNLQWNYQPLALLSLVQVSESLNHKEKNFMYTLSGGMLTLVTVSTLDQRYLGFLWCA